MMSHWLRGAGGASPNQGVELVDAHGPPRSQLAEPSHTPARVPSVDPAGDAAALEADTSSPEYRPLHGDVEGDGVPPACESTVEEAEWRELWYSWAGGYDAVSMMCGTALAALSPIQRVLPLGREWSASSLIGKNSLLIWSGEELRRRARALAALVSREPGTRATVEARGMAAESLLRSLGFSLVRRIAQGEPC